MTTKTKIITWGLVVVGVILLWVMFRGGNETTAENGVSTEIIEWKEFRPTQGNFVVCFPQLPQHAAEIVPLTAGQGAIKYDMFLTELKNGATFMISMIQYPSDYSMANPQELIDNTVKELLSSNSKNVLKNNVKGQFLNNPSCDFEICNGGVCLRSRAFVAGKVLYVLTVIDKAEAEAEKTFSKFVGSFDLNTSMGAPQASPTEIK